MLNEPNEAALSDPLTELFNERDNKLPAKEEKVITDKKSDQNKLEENLDEEDLNLDQEINLEPENKTPNPKIDSKKDKDNDNEIDVIRKRLEDNQSYSRTIRQNRDSAVAYVNKLIEEGDLPEEQASQLISILKSNTVKEPEGLTASEKKDVSSHPFQKFYDIANQDVIQTYLDVTEDDHYRDKVNAFDAFMTDASQEELEQLHKDLSNLEKKPVALLKKMLAVGQEYLDEGYDDYRKSGGFRKYSSIKKNEIEVLQNKVDKLNKKLSQYESYDKPTYSLEEASESTSKRQKSDDVLTEFFTERDAVRRR